MIYQNLSIHEKITVKQYVIDLNKNKRFHFSKPNILNNKINQLHLIYILS